MSTFLPNWIVPGSATGPSSLMSGSGARSKRVRSVTTPVTIGAPTTASKWAERCSGVIAAIRAPSASDGSTSRQPRTIRQVRRLARRCSPSLILPAINPAKPAPAAAATGEITAGL